MFKPVLVLSDPDEYEEILDALQKSPVNFTIPNPNQPVDDLAREILSTFIKSTLVVVQLSQWFLDNPTLSSVIRTLSLDSTTVFFCLDTNPNLPSWLAERDIQLIVRTTTAIHVRQLFNYIGEHPLVSRQISDGGNFFS